MIIGIHISIALNLLSLFLFFWLKKQLEIKSNNAERRIDKMNKSLPSIIGKVVGQIELAQDTINRRTQ